MIVLAPPALLQLCVLCLGFFQDRYIGIGVSPESEEILIGGAGLIAGGGVGRGSEGVTASDAEAGQRAPGKVRHQSTMVDELLKFHCRRVTVVEHEISFSTQIDRA